MLTYLFFEIGNTKKTIVGVFVEKTKASHFPRKWPVALNSCWLSHLCSAILLFSGQDIKKKNKPFASIKLPQILRAWDFQSWRSSPDAPAVIFWGACTGGGIPFMLAIPVWSLCVFVFVFKSKISRFIKISKAQFVNQL